MKKILLCILACIFVFALTACSQPTMSDEEILARAEELLEAQGKTIVDNNETSSSQGDELHEDAQDILDSMFEDSQSQNNSSKFNASDVINQISIEEYTSNNKFYTYTALILKNNSDYDLSIEVEATFLDESGNIVGTSTKDEHAFEQGCEIAMMFINEEDYSQIEYNYWVDEEDYFSPVLSSLALDVSQTEEKAIATVVNSGDKPAEFVECTALFFSGDTLVGFDQSYCIDGDDEIKPGSTQRAEMKCFDDFDSVKVYLTGRAE